MIARGEVQRVNVDLAAMARGILETLQRAEPGRRVQIVIAPDVRVSADPGLMRIVLQNLLSNAWKFTSRREVAHIEFGCDLEGSVSNCYVRDNGAGFEPALAGSCPALPPLHTQGEFQAGWGLATVQRIVRRHGGRVWAKGVWGRRTFGFTVSP